MDRVTNYGERDGLFSGPVVVVARRPRRNDLGRRARRPGPIPSRSMGAHPHARRLLAAPRCTASIRIARDACGWARRPASMRVRTRSSNCGSPARCSSRTSSKTCTTPCGSPTHAKRSSHSMAARLRRMPRRAVRRKADGAWPWTAAARSGSRRLAADSLRLAGQRRRGRTRSSGFSTRKRSAVRRWRSSSIVTAICGSACAAAG